MFRTTTVARTAWIGELTTTPKVGADGKAYDFKTIMFKMVSNRDYTVERTNNGVTTKEKPADFILCRANGVVAQLIHDHCKEKKVIAEGETLAPNKSPYVSRLLELAGHLETFPTTKEIPMTQDVTIDGVVYNIALKSKIDIDNVVFVVKELNFLDAGNKAKVITPKPVADNGVVITRKTPADANTPVTPPTTIITTGSKDIPVTPPAELTAEIKYDGEGNIITTEDVPF